MAQDTQANQTALREAFADGYALFSADLTPRGYGALAGLLRLAEAWDDDFIGFAEAIGALEGLYATLWTRRDRLSLLLQNDVEEWVEHFADVLDKDEIVRLVNSATQEASQEQHQDVRELLVAYLTAVLANHEHEAQELHDLLLKNLTASFAEGRVSGTALLAHRNGEAVDDLDDLYDSTFKVAKAHSDQFAESTNRAAGAAVGGIAGDIARHLTGSTANDSEKSKQVAIVVAAGVGAYVYSEFAAQGTYVDGQEATYSRSGVGSIDFLTVGDGRVCEECMGAEAGNPYELGMSPAPPLHVGCRCWLSPSD